MAPSASLRPTLPRGRAWASALLVLVLGAAVALLGQPVGPALAQSGHALPGTSAVAPAPAVLQSRADVTPQPRGAGAHGHAQPQATPSATPTVTPPPGANCEWLNPGQCIQNFINTIQFDFATMFTAVTTMVSRLLQGMYDGVRAPFTAALQSVLFSAFGIAPAPSGSSDPLYTALFADLIWPHWLLTLTLAAALLPLTLTLTAVEALKQGAASVLATAQLKEALMHWGLSAGAAAASYYGLSLAYRLSTSSAYWLLTASGGGNAPDRIGQAVFPPAVVTLLVAATANPALASVALLLTGFLMFLSVALVLGLLFALVAVIALVYLVAVLAPIVIVLGQVPPLRWLHDLWLKTVVVVFLLPPANALLLRAALLLGDRIIGADGWASAIVSIVVMAGVLSALITIDYKVGEAVFGGLQQVWQRYGESLLDLGRLALSAATVLATGSPLGLGAALSGGGGAAPRAGGGDVSAAAGATVTGAPVVSASSDGATGSAGSSGGGPSAEASGGNTTTGGSVRSRLTDPSTPRARVRAEGSASLMAFKELAERRLGPSALSLTDGQVAAADARLREAGAAEEQQQRGEGLRAAGGILAGSRNGALRLAGQGLSAAGNDLKGRAATEQRRSELADRLADRAVADARYARAQAQQAEDRQARARRGVDDDDVV